MSRTDRQAVVLPSVLDRLLDDAPDSPMAGAVLYLGLAHLKAALARDLEMLLNTRVVNLDARDDLFPLSSASIIAFGIPDLSGLSLLNPDDWEALRESVRRAIERYEPRLSRVQVAIDLSQGAERLVRFRVDAMLKIHPGQPRVSFDATLQLSSNSYRVRG